MKRSLLLLVTCLSVLGTSCKASVSADAKASGGTAEEAEAEGSAKAEGSLEADVEGEGDARGAASAAGEATPSDEGSAPQEHGRAQAPSGAPSEAAPPGGPSGSQPSAPAAEQPALLGSRQDLIYRGPARATCGCLAVTVGQPRDPAFEWATSVPRTNASQQLVVAFSSHGIACPKAAADSLGATYWGLQMRGNDVVIVVEEARKGRPMTAGAVIPRPTRGGKIYVRPLTKKVPYGWSLDGKQPACEVSEAGATTASAAAQPAPSRP